MLVLQIASVFAVHLGHALGVGFWGVVHFLGRQGGGSAGGGSWAHWWAAEADCKLLLGHLVTE